MEYEDIITLGVSTDEASVLKAASPAKLKNRESVIDVRFFLPPGAILYTARRILNNLITLLLC